jgi:hypothetical protein
MALTFLQYDNFTLRVATKAILLSIDNPGAIFTQNKVMVIHPENKTFQVDEIEKITELLNKDFK